LIAVIILHHNPAPITPLAVECRIAPACMCCAKET
jgi:hypothetical protein